MTSSELPQLQSFTNLADADILKRELYGIGFEVSFKHERFYDYFIGRRIFHLSKTQTDRYTYFLDLIGRTTTVYFLWWAARNALVEEAKKPGYETILKLCRAGKLPRAKEMMVDVLITLSLGTPELVEEILKSLMPLEKKSDRNKENTSTPW